MSEYIFDVPDSNQPIAGDTGLYYSDERDEPMMVREEIVRCADCRYYKEKVYKWVNNWTRTEKTCDVFDGCRVEPDGFCAWGEKVVEK